MSPCKGVELRVGLIRSTEGRNLNRTDVPHARGWLAAKVGPLHPTDRKPVDQVGSPKRETVVADFGMRLAENNGSERGSVRSN